MTAHLLKFRPPNAQVGRHGFSRHKLAKDQAQGSAMTGRVARERAAAAQQHQVGGGETSASSSGAGAGAAAAISTTSGDLAGADSPCTSFFLQEALKWMDDAAKGDDGGAADGGKLLCYGCGARVGALRWAGSQCSCGTWVTPAVQLSKKALDQRRIPRAGAAGPGAK